MSPAHFAQNEYRDREVYAALAAIETVPAVKDILEKFTAHEAEDFAFWKGIAPVQEYRLLPGTLQFYRFMRYVFGLTFTIKFLEGGEHKSTAEYASYLQTITDPSLRARIEAMVAREAMHEQVFLDQVEEHTVSTLSNVVLGINDGVIELTGALSGFSLVFSSSHVVALAGFITGIAATLSMTASAYLQAEHEAGKNAWSAALATGISYLVVVGFLVTPFVINTAIVSGLTWMFLAAFLIVLLLSFYSAVLLGERFWLRFGKMLLLSFGVALISFLLGYWAKRITGITL